MQDRKRLFRWVLYIFFFGSGIGYERLSSPTEGWSDPLTDLEAFVSETSFR